MREEIDIWIMFLYIEKLYLNEKQVLIYYKIKHAFFICFRSTTNDDFPIQ